MGATLGSALQSPVAVSATRLSSSPWKATLWNPQAMWIPPEQGEAGMCPCQPCSHSERCFGCTDHHSHHTWAVEIGIRGRCVLHIWGLSGGKGMVKEPWHIKKPQLGVARVLHATGNILLPASAMNNTPWGWSWHRSTCRRVTPLFPPVFSLSTSIHFL